MWATSVRQKIKDAGSKYLTEVSKSARIEVDLADYENIIKVNNLQEVSEAMYFDSNRQVNQDGLFSTRIFGRTEKERKMTWAYLDLKCRLIQPNAYKVLTRLDTKIEKIINKSDTFKLDENGHIVKDEEGHNGISWLYEIFDDIKWKETDSNARKQRLEYLSNFEKDMIFQSTVLIIPPFYRDINIHRADSLISVDAINDFYANLIRWSKAVEEANKTGLPSAADSTKARMQDEWVSLYDMLIDQPNIGKKKGKIRVGVLGKTVEYGARSVITAPRFDRITNNIVDFEHCGLPITMTLVNFFPFALNWLDAFFKNELGYKETYPFKGKDGETYEVELDKPMEKFNKEYYQKRIDGFIQSPNSRFDPIEIPTKAKHPVYMYIRGRATKDKTEESPLMNRRATWTDIFYMCAVDIVKEKHVLLTRYPVEDHYGVFPIKVNPLSTVETQPMFIGDKFYQHYPVIDMSIPRDKVSIQFLDTLKISNLYLDGLGGDYDGDQLSIKGLWTEESNNNAKEIRDKKSFLLNAGGSNMRTVSQEAIQAMYTLTK